MQPTAIARQLMELVGLHLETVVLADEVAHVEIRAAVVGRLGERQGELFADRWPTDPHQLAVLVNRLSSRLGYEQVVRPRLGASPVPERAVRYEPVAGREQGDKEQGVERRTPRSLLALAPCSAPRPLLLYPEPQPIEVTALRRMVRRNLFGSTGGASGSPRTGGRSGSRRCGGAGRRCGATTIASSPRRAASSGSSAGSRMGSGFCMGSLL